MKKVIVFMVLVLIFFVLLAHGDKRGVLIDILKPEAIEVSGNRLYVSEGAMFLVYSLDNLNLITKFGKKGEGPGELKVVPMLPNTIEVLPDQIFVEGVTKVIFFSNDFNILKETRKKEGYRIFKIRPVGNNFVAIRMVPPIEEDKKYYLSLSLLDSQMNVIKELFKQEFPEREKDIVMVTDTIHFAVYKDKIYAENSERGFLIDVFNSKGNRLFNIKRNFKSQKITENDKKIILKNLKEDNMVMMMIQGSGGWENFKKSMNFIYPETFPQIQDIIVDNNKIYVSTFEKKGEKEKYIIMDLNGKMIKTIYLPIPQQTSFTSQTIGRGNRLYGISNSKFYYLIENEDNEEWELHMTKINL